MAYEGVEIVDSFGRPLGLRVKNGVIQNEPQFDFESIKARIKEINSGPLPQTLAKIKAREEALNKRRK